MSSDLNPNVPQAMDLAALRAKLAQEDGKRFWQSLEELAETKEYREFLENEFPHDPAKDPEGLNRRDVLKLAAASAALAGLSACTKLPTQKIVPYVKAPEEIVAGKPLFYATSMPLAGVAAGLLVESHMGRPTKIEGNPEHPGSLGGTDVFAQAATLGMYDPDRSQTVVFQGRISRLGRVPHRDGQYEISGHVCRRRRAADSHRHGDFANSGRADSRHPERISGTRNGISTSRAAATTSREGAQACVRQAGKHRVPLRPGRRDRVARRRFRFLGPRARALRARILLRAASLMESNRESEPPVRRRKHAHAAPARLQTIAGRCERGAIEAFARELAAAAGVPGATAIATTGKIPAEWTRAVAKDLAAHRGTSLVIAGEEQPPAVHALAHAMNAALGNVGKTVYYTEPLEANPVNETGIAARPGERHQRRKVSAALHAGRQ